MIGNELLRYNSDQKFVVFDFETEGLNLYSSRPWQISWIVALGGNVLESHNYYLKIHDLNISEGAKRVTHFNEDEFLKNAEDPCVVLDRFNKYLYDEQYRILGHNVLGFDIYQHNNLMRYCGKKTDYSYINRLIDTHCLCKAIKLDFKYREGDDLLSWQYRLLDYVKRGLKTNLGLMAKENDIVLDETKLHLADYDIVINYELWNKIKWFLEIS
jgi:DNA polymerase III alpha subunit (gram-positive type)